jgi:hypothetical protein
MREVKGNDESSGTSQARVDQVLVERGLSDVAPVEGRKVSQDHLSPRTSRDRPGGKMNQLAVDPDGRLRVRDRPSDSDPLTRNGKQAGGRQIVGEWLPALDVEGLGTGLDPRHPPDASFEPVDHKPMLEGARGA